MLNDLERLFNVIFWSSKTSKCGSTLVKRITMSKWMIRNKPDMKKMAADEICTDH